MPAVTIPDPALVVLIGPSGSGKSTWAADRYRQDEIVCSDRLRAVVGSGEQDLDASADAFALLGQIVAARLRRGLTTVVDTLGLDQARRQAQLELARQAGLPGVAVLFGTPAAECKRRNRARARPVPAAVLDGQLRRMTAVAGEVAAEGWTVLTAVHRRGGGAVARGRQRGRRRGPARRPGQARPGSADLPVRLGLRSGRLAGIGRRRRRAGRPGRRRADGPPDPDPPGWPGLGSYSGTLGDPRPAGRADLRPAPRHPGQPGDLPGSRPAGQDRRHPGRTERRPGVLRPGSRLVGARARRLRTGLPASGAAA